MSSRCFYLLAFVLGTIASAVQPAHAQQLDALTIGFRAQPVRASAPPPDDAPSTLVLGRVSVLWASLGAAMAGGVGYIIDDTNCQLRHDDEPAGLFGPCFLPAAGATAAGWFGGSVIGATMGAARVARRRGCPSRTATMRALAGAALGAAPGLIIVAGRPGKYPPSHTALVLGAPLLSAVGAAVSVAGCRGP